MREDDAVSISTPPGMPEQTRPWWSNAAVYQIYPRSFQDSDGDGFGDLRGIIDRVDHLATLGVDVLWLSPVYRSPQADNGYDISDYEDIDPLFGTLDDLEDLIAALHERGIRLVMDLVVNHTSDEHPWFVESRSSRDNPKRDWYVWRDAGPDGGLPNNWESFFSGPVWQLDETTGQYYLHLFDRKQPDLNWENEEVRQAVYAMMRRWLDRGVDGFRMDVINLISKVPGLPDGEVAPGGQFGNGFPYFANGPRIHEFLHEMNTQVFAGRNGLITVAETPGATAGDAVLYTDPARAEVDMIFQFEHVGLDMGAHKFDDIGLDLVKLKSSLHAWQRALADRGWNSLYWDNHDQPRVVSRFGDDDPQFWATSAKTLATILHGMRGTPYIYQGQELGMTNYPFRSVGEFVDVESVNFATAAMLRGQAEADLLPGLAKYSRDNARTPVQWTGETNAGFTSGTPWLPVNPNHSWLNAQAQVGSPGSVFEHYRELIRLRHEQDVMAVGDFTAIAEDDPTLWAYRRDLGDRTMLVVANCSREPRDLDWADLGDLAGAELVLGTHEAGTTSAATSGPLTLAPWESRIYLRN